ncbi:GNAT family N-acetyltransferase [Archangium violaceum]|uniref:GNAT family N-acetyltransferase n=1 Tax=Archangium violaceum TaxID=83451 RepID=UPI0006962CBE|nr:GNAT family N-acetyltransferase [Archangium violaceum]
MGLRVEPLGRQHRTLLKGFQNQHVSLAEYLQRYALRHLEKDLLARTYVAIDEGQEGLRLAGYFSLSTVSVERSAAGNVPGLERLPRFPIPGVLLARLAVDQRVQGQGLGRFLFEEALGLTLQLAQSGPVAFRLFVTDAIDAQAARFYERFGFKRLADEYPCRMVLDLLPLLATTGTT